MVKGNIYQRNMFPTKYVSEICFQNMFPYFMEQRWGARAMGNLTGLGVAFGLYLIVVYV